MNMHEIRYDIALLPLIILSSDLCSRKLQPWASQSKCSLKKNKTKQNKKTLSFCLSFFFFYFIWIKYSNIWARACERNRGGRKGERERAQRRSRPPCEWRGLLGVERGGCNGMRSDLEYRHCGQPQLFCKRSICSGGLGFRPPSHQSSQPILLFDSSVQGLTFDTQDPRTYAQTQADALREGRRGRERKKAYFIF